MTILCSSCNEELFFSSDNYYLPSQHLAAAAIVYKLAVGAVWCCHNKTLAAAPACSSSKDTDCSLNAHTG